MTQAQMLRYQRRKILERKQAERRVETIKALIIMVLILLAFGLAGSVDYQDRAAGLGANMLPSDSWFERGDVLTTKEVG